MNISFHLFIVPQASEPSMNFNISEMGYCYELMSRESHNSVINEIDLPCGNSIYDSHELSNAFNDRFSSIGPKLPNNIHANEDNRPISIF